MYASNLKTGQTAICLTSFLYFNILRDSPSRYDKGGYLFLPSYLMRTHGSRHQQDAVKRIPAREMQKVYDVRNGI